VPHARLDSNPVDPPVREPETTEMVGRHWADGHPSTKATAPIVDGEPRTITDNPLDHRPIADKEQRCAQVFAARNSNADRMDGAW